MNRAFPRFLFASFLIIIATHSFAAVMPYNYRIETVEYVRLTTGTAQTTFVHDLQIAGNRLYGIGYSFIGFDVTDPSAPRQLFNVGNDQLGYVQEQAIAGQYAFLQGSTRCWYADLRQSAPTLQPLPISVAVRTLFNGHYMLASTQTRFAVKPSGSNVEVNLTSYTTEIWDVANPASPSQVALLKGVTEP